MLIKRLVLEQPLLMAMLQVGIAITMDGTAGVITATKFVGEGSQLTGVSGLGTALSNDTTNVLSKVFFVNQTLDITSETTVTAPDSASQSDDGLMLHILTSKTLM